MNLVPVMPVDYATGVVSVALRAADGSGLVAFCLLLLTVAAALAVAGVLALFLARLDG